jgi:hypothetical protein
MHVISAVWKVIIGVGKVVSFFQYKTKGEPNGNCNGETEKEIKLKSKLHVCR